MEFWTKFLIWFFLIDLYGYWAHVWFHMPGSWMGKYHDVHHEAFKWHFHFIEVIFIFVIPFIVSVPLMGLEFCVVAVAVILFESYRGHGGLSSASKHTAPRPVFYFLCTRGYHKQHHLYAEYNIGQITPLWDHIMGTVKKREND